MLVINFETDSPKDIQDKLWTVPEHVAANSDVMGELCELLPNCNCFRLVSIELEWGQGVWMTFEGHNGKRRVCVQPPPANFDRRRPPGRTS